MAAYTYLIPSRLYQIISTASYEYYFYKYISPKFQDREPHTKDEIIPGKKSTKIQSAQIVQTRPLDSTWGKLPKTKVGGDPEISWNLNKWVHTPASPPSPHPKLTAHLYPIQK